jgi:hypothetical protein
VRLKSNLFSLTQQGFVQAEVYSFSSPELKLNKEIKVKDNNQKTNRIP